ncbi:YcxB family protein [Streptomyces sp. NPDC101160]|uniref:YcxB family protein n=1 Tax=Streptomyces sp. NPDC101160 TaxID=3366118 RepID=UPI0037F6A098
MELVYTPTRADVLDAIRVRMRTRPSGRRLRWLMPLTAVLAALVIVLKVTRPEPDAGGIVLMVWLGLTAALMPTLVPRLTARQMWPILERQGEFRARVDDEGVRYTTRDTEVVNRWQMLTRYVETPTQFVLLTADKPGVGFATLPKRALTGPGDVDRLRAFLDARTARI